MEPAHGPPLQARVAAANRTVSQLANMLIPRNDDPGAHGMEQGQAKQNEMTGRGQTVEEGSGHGKASRHTACRTGTAGKHSRRTLRPAQASK